jgi:hypothetical protein
MLAHGAGQEEILVRLLRHRAGEAFGRKSERCVGAGRIRPLLALGATHAFYGPTVGFRMVKEASAYQKQRQPCPQHVAHTAAREHTAARC